MGFSNDAKDVLERIKRFPKREVLVNTYKYNEGVRLAWTPMWVRNLSRTYSEVERRFVEKDCDMRALPRVTDTPVLILGSGPSLDDVVPLLKDWKGTICCSTSQLLLLEYLRVTPTYCILIDCDPNPEIIKLLGDYQGDPKKTIFITHPQIPREYLQQWKGEVYFFRMLDPGDEFSTKYVPMATGWMNQEKGWQVGSYVLNSGNVVNAAIPIMAGLGYGPIFLCGYDLGYPGEIYRGKSVKKVNGLLELQEPSEMPSQKVRPIVYAPGINGVLSDELCYFYKYSFMILYGLGNMPILSCSRGLLGEVPYVDPKEVVAAQGKGFEGKIRPHSEAYEIARQYLRGRSIYILKTDFHVETVNIHTKKGFQKLLFVLKNRFLARRPWIWRNDKVGLLTTSYRTWKIRKIQAKQAAMAKKVAHA